MISSAPGTADTPRAHLVNPFAIGESQLFDKRAIQILIGSQNAFAT